MKFQFTQKVRDSIATNILRASWSGAAMIAAVGYHLKTYWPLMGVLVWWILMQIIGNYILGLEDDIDSS